MREYGFQDSYIATCEQLYSASNTYYMTIHGNTTPLRIYRGTLQGDTLSPFLFTIFMEPLLRWLAVGSRGYKPTYQPHKSTSTIITYDDHGYADDVSITAGSIQDLKIQLKNYIYSANAPGFSSKPPSARPRDRSGGLAIPLTTKTKTSLKNKSTPLHLQTAPT
jgi:hypothetical protein